MGDRQHQKIKQNRRVLSKQEQEVKWSKIEKGEIPDDYTNALLSLLGFHDRPLNPQEQASRERELKRNNSL